MARTVVAAALVLSTSHGFIAHKNFPVFQLRERRFVDSVVVTQARDRFDEEDDYAGESFRGYDNFDDWEAAQLRRRKQRRGDGEVEVVGGGMWARLIPQQATNALLAGIFVLGVGTGVTVDSAINTDPKDLASRDAIDQAAPNKELCQQYGSSAMVMDQRVFVSFNPFNVYVTQADTKPGCVLRPSTVVPILASRGLLDKNEIASCKNNMNTWAFVGDLDGRPQLSCVYKSQDAQNEFLSNPTIGLGEDVYDDGLPREKMQGRPDQDAYSTAKRVKQ